MVGKEYAAKDKGGGSPFMDLTKLKNDAASVTDPNYNLLSGFLVLICERWVPFMKSGDVCLRNIYTPTHKSYT